MNGKSLLIILIIVGISLGFSMNGFAQEKPPRPIKVTTFQNLCFGAFFQGMTGGSVIVYPDGTRTTTGDVIQANLGYLFFPAIFEVDAQPGVVINITKGTDAILTGSNGGSMVMKTGNTYPVSPFVNTLSPPGKTQVRVGGTLIVGSPLANPEGSYSGTFSITFNQE